ncbi:unnamed protein product [Closterium sp. NIES-53]
MADDHKLKAPVRAISPDNLVEYFVATSTTAAFPEAMPQVPADQATAAHGGDRTQAESIKLALNLNSRHHPQLLLQLDRLQQEIEARGGHAVLEIVPAAAGTTNAAAAASGATAAACTTPCGGSPSTLPPKSPGLSWKGQWLSSAAPPSIRIESPPSSQEISPSSNSGDSEPETAGAAPNAGECGASGSDAVSPSPPSRAAVAYNPKRGVDISARWRLNGRPFRSSSNLDLPDMDCYSIYEDTNTTTTNTGTCSKLTTVAASSAAIASSPPAPLPELPAPRRDVADLRTEVMLMGLLKVHSEVVQVHEVFEDRKAVHLVMELCKGGDLFDFIQSAPKGRLNDRHAASVMRQLLGALHHCHSLGVLHRDVKPENILLCDRMPHQTSNGEVGIKLSDFGVAGFLNDDGVCTDSAGTSEYMAPEMAMKAPYNAKADVWSAGVVLYAMLAGGLPSWAALPDEFNKQAGSTGGGSRRGKGKTMQEGIAWNELCLNRGVWRGVSEEAKDLLRALLRKDPEGRPSALEALGECGAVGHWVSAVRRY